MRKLNNRQCLFFLRRNRLGIGQRLFGIQPQFAAQPQAKQLAGAGFALEAQLGIMGKFVLKGAFTVVQSGHIGFYPLKMNRLTSIDVAFEVF